MHPRPSTIYASAVSWNRFLSSASQLPLQLHFIIQARFASTASENPYPYPSHPNPSPHQIFHLPFGAPQTDIKARYYELVRLHHPDSHHCRILPPEVRHARFQSISSAYDVLRRGGTYAGQREFDMYAAEVERRRRAYNVQRRYQEPFMNPEKPGNEFRDEVPPSPQQLMRERVILLLGVLAIMAGVYPSLFFGSYFVDQRHKSAVTNLTQARKEAMEVGEERRARVRERVKEYKQRAEAVENGEMQSMPSEVQDILRRSKHDKRSERCSQPEQSKEL